MAGEAADAVARHKRLVRSANETPLADGLALCPGCGWLDSRRPVDSAAAATVTAITTPASIRPLMVFLRRFRAIWVLDSGGVIPTSSPVAGSPRCKITEWVIRNGLRSRLPLMKVPRRD